MLCNKLTRHQANALYLGVLEDGNEDTLRELCRVDLFFLLTVALQRKDANTDWLYARCREVEAGPNGYLDLWAREHYKSTIITFAKTIQDILASHGEEPLPEWKGEEAVIGIFSHTRPIAKGFLSQIKTEFEDNTFLKSLFPDILHTDPKRSAKVWSLDTGIQVKRKSNPKEQTVEAWGLVDGQPTSKHFNVLVYDDVVTLASVTTPEMIAKVTEAFRLSLNLGTKDGKRRGIGTRYHYNDTYRSIMANGTLIPRIHKATDNGKVTGKPVFLTAKTLAEKRRDYGPYVFACQMLQDPKEDSVMGFKEDWLMYYDRLRNCEEWNYYLLIDPASKKKKDNDYTVMLVMATAPDGNYYLVDGVRDRLNLTQRSTWLFRLHRKWRPLKVGYEEYGLQADIEHMQYEMSLQNYRFNITPLGGKLSKEDRIRRMVPGHEQHRHWYPHALPFMDYEGRMQDLINAFINEEYLAFPVAVHDDILDCEARIYDKDLDVKFPEVRPLDNPSITMNQEPDKLITEYDVLAS